MKMKREQKDALVSGLKERFTQSSTIYVTDFTGLSVKHMTDLRRRFRRAGADFLVAKNTLAIRALREASIDAFDDVLEGPTAFVFAGSEPVGAAKVIADFRRETDNKPTVKAGLVDGKRVTPEEVHQLSKLPTREELLAQAAGALQGPLQGFVGVLSGLLSQFVGALEALRAQRADAS